MTADSADVDAVRSEWRLTYDGFDPSTEGKREALCALGNGYFATRGAAPWAKADGVRYPGVYLAGGYNRLRTRIGDREVENEDLVNLPNWLNLDFDIGQSGAFDERRVRLLSYRQELDLEHGLLLRTLSFEDSEGRRSTLRERRIVSMAHRHLGALEVTLTAENWSGTVAIRSGVDGRVVNAGAKLYASFSNRHLQPIQSEPVANDAVLLVMRTSGSGLVVAQGARTRVTRNGEAVEPKGSPTLEPGYASLSFEAPVAAGETLRIEKLAVLYTSRDPAIFEPSSAARNAIVKAGSFDEAHAAHALAWEQLWHRFDIRMEMRRGAMMLGVPMLLRLNLFHLLQTASPNSIGLDMGVPARGWTGEAYQGHIFWDELFIFPTLVLRLPEITRSLLMYRYRRLDEARAAAASAGFRGAMFPWQSGSDGREETQKANLNPRSQRWVTDNSFRQRHVGSAVAWNVWQYVQVTGDRQFLLYYGAELILEIARFWSSVAQYNPALERYEIRGVMGPDEFHEGYPDATPTGVDNNAYTNLMAAWVLWRALDVLELIGEVRRAELIGRLGLSSEEIVRWDQISRRMYVPIHDDGVISQFEGYERLAELDWTSYRARYDNIQRMELILEAEGDSANRYKVAKQADVLMLFYLFSSDGLCVLLDRLGYHFNPEMIPQIADYYDSRTSHGSTLSRVVSAWVFARSDRHKAIGYLAEALLSDVEDIQGGTTAEGVHLGAMAASVDLVLRACTGIHIRDDSLRFNPQLPRELNRLELSIRYHGHVLDLDLTRHSFRVCSRSPGPASFRLACGANEIDFPPGGDATFDLRRD